MAEQPKLPDELPLKVDCKQVEQYVRRLADLTTDKIVQRPNAIVPPEAVDFIGVERAAMHEKVPVISARVWKDMRMRKICRLFPSLN